MPSSTKSTNQKLQCRKHLNRNSGYRIVYVTISRLKGEIMFGKIIYYDKKAVAEYKSVISGKPNLEIEEYDVSNDKGIIADLKLVSADVKASKSYKAKVQESDLYDCDLFEKC